MLLLFGALYRVLFGQAKSLHQQLYVDAAAVDGVKPMTASLRHVLPNMSTTLVVQFVLLFGAAIGLQAGLAFIGLGPQPPEPTWGGMIQTASRFIFQQPWMMVPTGGVLALTIIAANSLSDVLGGGSAMPPPLVSLEAQEDAGGCRDRGIRRPRTPTPAATPAAASAGDVPAEPTASLVVHNLVIGVDDGPDLVTGVSLRVGRGRVMGLVGESGCGKSVTSYAMLGLLAPGLSVRSGRILWNGVDLARADEKTLQRVRGHEIAFISQEPTRALDPMFTVGWQLAASVKRLRGVGGRVRRSASQQQLLTDVGIVDPPRVLKSYPHQISGGMAQRVAIALALCRHAAAAHRRRTDDRPRRHRPGRDPRAAARTDRRTRNVDHPRDARPRRRRRPLRRRLGDVRRADRRDRFGARCARAPRASVHDGAAGRRPARDHRLRGHDPPRVHPRPGAPARFVDERLPLRGSAAGSPRTSA